MCSRIRRSTRRFVFVTLLVLTFIYGEKLVQADKTIVLEFCQSNGFKTVDYFMFGKSDCVRHTPYLTERIPVDMLQEMVNARILPNGV